MDEDALLAWFGGKQYAKLGKRKHKKLQDRADDDNGNDDKSSQDYIPMEKISRQFVKTKNQEDDKKTKKAIRESLQPRSAAKDAGGDNTPAPAAMDEPVKEYLDQKENYDKIKRKKLIKEQLQKDDPDRKATREEVKKLKQIPTTDDQVESAERSGARNLAELPSTTPQQPTLQGNTTPDVSNTLSPNNVPDETKALIEEQKVQDDEKAKGENPPSRAPTARPLSLYNQLPPTETQPIVDIPGGSGELAGVEVNDPPGTKPPDLQLDIPANTESVETKTDPVLNDLSAEYRRAVSKPITLAGAAIDPASAAYDAADRSIAPLQLMNEGLLKAPTGLARLANFINYPLDKVAGTDAFGKNNKMLDKADQFIDSFGVTRAPTNAAERAFTALGMLALPNPGTMLAPVAGSVGIGLNEGVYQVAEAVKRRLQTDPPVQNKYDELEPRVTSVDAKTAKDIQQKVDADARSFLPKFTEANYTDTMLYTAGAAIALAGLYKGRNFLKSPVAGRTILNPEKAIVEELPESITTSKEVLRTVNQDANYVLESQAKKFNDLDLVHDISTSTRAGLASRVENLVETGAVNTPGYNTQLSVSPKQLVEFHLQRPIQEQQDVSRAFHILDQVDSAKLSKEKRALAKSAEQPHPVVEEAPTAVAEPAAPRTVREQIEDAYKEVTGGKSAQNVTLDQIRSRLPNVSREEFDTALREFTSGRDKSAVLSQLTDPKSLTAAQREATYAPAGEPFHSIWFNKLSEAKAAETPKVSAKAETPTTERAPTARDDNPLLAAQPDYVAMPNEPDIKWAEALLAKEENAGVVRAMREIREAKARVAESSGKWDAQTTSNMLEKRPNYVHRVETHDYNVTPEGGVANKSRIQSIMDSMKSKQGSSMYDAGGGAELASTEARSRVNAPNQMLDAILANVDDLQKTVVFAHENDIVKRFYNGLQTSEETAKAIKPLKEGDKVPKGFESVTFYDGGKQVRFAVEPLTARALKFAPTSAASRYNIAATIRNAFQQATTGPVLAPFFAPTSFAMEASIGAATRSRSLRVGNIDAALQSVSGGKLAAPGDMFGAMAAGVGAIRRAQRADSILHAAAKTEEYLLKYGNRSLQDLESQMPGVTKKIARGLAVGQDATLENVLAQNRELYEQTAKGWALKNGALHSSQNELMRNANRFYSGDVLKAFEGHFGAEEGQRWWQYWKGLVTNIHDAGRLSLVEKNLDRVGDKQLAYEARKFSGDLGVRGMGNMESGYILSDDVSKAAQVATRLATSKPVGSVLDAAYASIPYINPHIQGTTRFLEQLAKQPTTVIAAVAGSTMLPSLGSLGWAAMLGTDHLDYLLNRREEYKKTGYIYIGIPGSPPEDGLDIRIDPVLSPFGYPVIEAMDSVFGIRKMIGQTRDNKLAPNAEQQGMISALQEGIKEAIGFGMPIQASMALASQGYAAGRNVFDPGYALRPEQASKLGSGKNPSSALSVPMQLMLENVLGATAQHAIAGMDAYASTGKKESAVGNAAKATGISFLSKMPAAGLAAKIPGAETMFAGKTYNESGTALAANVRTLTNSAKRIEAGINAKQNILLKSKNAQAGSGEQTPGIKMGNPGIVQLPPQVEAKMDEFHKALALNGKLKGINSERSAISTSLTGLRAVNAGNLSRHVLVPLKEGREIGGLGYTILNEELLKQELAKEEDSRVNPQLTPKTGKVAKQQRSQIVKDLVGGVPKVSRGKVQDLNDRFYKAPTLKEVTALRNALNQRRYTLDLQAADEFEGIEKQMGVKLNDLAKAVKLTPEAEASIDDED